MRIFRTRSRIRRLECRTTCRHTEVVCAAADPDPAEVEREAQRTAAQDVVIDKVAGLVAQTEGDAVVLATALSKEIAAGVLEVETNGRKIVLRVKEHGSFPSGSASLTSDFKPVLKIIRGVLKDTQGRFDVEGHTDDVPIATSQFNSNLELSSSRAISVAHGLFEDGAIDERRFTVAGYADSRPLVPNDTAEGRARNRRIEIVIRQGLGNEVKSDLDALRQQRSARLRPGSNRTDASVQPATRRGLIPRMMPKGRWPSALRGDRWRCEPWRCALRRTRWWFVDGLLRAAVAVDAILADQLAF